jgi:hypothetical protein
MFSFRVDLLPVSAFVLLVCSPVAAQSVVSARSGVVHFFEGLVYIGDQRLERQFAKFPDIPEGATLRTTQGRAEILLTPGVILRIGESSAIRMVNSELADTRVEMLSGSGVLEVMEARPENSVKIIYKNWQVRFRRAGVYRIDSQPPQLRVLRGDAEVSAGTKEAAAVVKAGETLPFAEVLVPDQTTAVMPDLLSDWAADRSQAISTDNSIAAQITDDPTLPGDPNLISSSALAAGGFTYFPRLGIPMISNSLFSPYGFGSWNPYSIYMPGYTYFSLYPGSAGRIGYVPLPRVGTPPPVGSSSHHGVTPPPHTPTPAPAPAPHIGIGTPRVGHR